MNSGKIDAGQGGGDRWKLKVLQEVLADLKIFIKLENPGIAYPYVTNIYMCLPANKFVPHNDYLFPRAVFLSSLVFTILNNSPQDVVL